MIELVKKGICDSLEHALKEKNIKRVKEIGQDLYEQGGLELMQVIASHFYGRKRLWLGVQIHWHQWGLAILND